MNPTNTSNKKSISVLFIVIAIIVISYFTYSHLKNSPPSTPPAITYTNATSDNIKVELPFPDAVVGKEFSVIGQARGMWFFEASFPVELLDKGGHSLATGIAQAQSNWMTADFVPFKTEIKVPDSYIGPATLVLKKDNPSGMAENDASVKFPITVEY